MSMATAISPTAAEADALATAFYVMGVEETRSYCKERPETAALLVPDQSDTIPIIINMTDEWMPSSRVRETGHGHEIAT
jgi:hypothetical protein